MDTRLDDQRRCFERLCLLRALYVRRGPRDASGVISIGETIAHANALLAHAQREADQRRSADSTV